MKAGKVAHYSLILKDGGSQGKLLVDLSASDLTSTFPNLLKPCQGISCIKLYHVN